MPVLTHKNNNNDRLTHKKIVHFYPILRWLTLLGLLIAPYNQRTYEMNLISGQGWKKACDIEVIYSSCFSELNRTTRVILRNRVTCWSIFHTPIPQTQKTNWGEGKRINSLNLHWQISLCEKTDEKMLWHHWTHGQKRSWIPFKIEVI